MAVRDDILVVGTRPGHGKESSSPGSSISSPEAEGWGEEPALAAADPVRSWNSEALESDRAGLRNSPQERGDTALELADLDGLGSACPSGGVRGNPRKSLREIPPASGGERRCAVIEVTVDARIRGMGGS